MRTNSNASLEPTDKSTRVATYLLTYTDPTQFFMSVLSDPPVYIICALSVPLSFPNNSDMNVWNYESHGVNLYL